MMYTVVTSSNGKSYYLCREKIGGGYNTIATFLNEQLAKETAAILNNVYFDATARKEPTRLREVKK